MVEWFCNVFLKIVWFYNVFKNLVSLVKIFIYVIGDRWKIELTSSFMSDMCEESCDLSPGIFFRTNPTELRIVSDSFQEGGACIKPSSFTTGVRLVHDSIEEWICHDVSNRYIIRRRRSEARPFLTSGSTVRFVTAAKPKLATAQIRTTATVLGGDVEDTGEKYADDN